MPNLFETSSSFEEEDFTDEAVAVSSFDGTRQISLKYGTETVYVDLTLSSYSGKTLAQIAGLRADELGFSRDASGLNYRRGGESVEPSFIPKPGMSFVLSTSADTKGRPDTKSAQSV
jgi:hypothetical protein